jgi:WD repeat-containing protein 48
MLPVLSQSSTGLGITSLPDLLPPSGSPTALSNLETTLQQHKSQSSPQLQATLHPREVSTTAGTQAQDYFGPPVSSGGSGSGVPAPTTPEDPSGASGTVGTNQGGGGTSGPAAALSTPGGGLMGKLRGLGRTTKRAHSEGTPGTPAVPPPSQSRTPTAAVPSAQTPASTTRQEAPAPPPVKTRTAAMAVLASGPLNPPPTADGPALPLAPDIPLLVAEERAYGWAIVYRGTVASAGSVEDVEALEDALPVWLLEYLLLARAPQVAVVKIGFVLLPLQSGVPGEEVLPELVNT